MVNGRALYYAIIVSLLISIICGLFISVAHLNSLQQIDQFDRQRYIRNVNSGIALLLENENESIELTEKDLFGNQEDSIIWFKKKWGMLTVAGVRTINQVTGFQDTLSKVFFISPLIENNKTALYLADSNKPLSLLGNTRITGNAYLPKTGVKRGTLNGMSYTGSQLIYGQQKQSSFSIPPFTLDPLFEFISIANNEILLPDFLKHKHSFFEETIVEKANVIGLKEEKFQGNYIFIANQEIVVESNVQLEDVVLIAPKITFKSGFSGSVQAFATQELIVDENCQLAFPSILGLLSNTNPNQNNHLTIHANSKVSGLVFATKKERTTNPPKLAIHTAATIEGQVVSDGVLALEGTVLGNVTCAQFLLQTTGSSYDNYLANGIIDVNKFPFTGLFPFKNQRNTKNFIAKWVN